MAHVLESAPHGCVAMRYPRRMHNVLSPADVNHLASIFFYHRLEYQRNAQHYYQLLTHIASRAPRHERTAEILERIKAYVARHFGRQFMLLNDFYSFRSAEFRQFPVVHQDAAFWVNDAKCSGFNLWCVRARARIDVHSRERAVAPLRD